MLTTARILHDLGLLDGQVELTFRTRGWSWHATGCSDAVDGDDLWVPVDELGLGLGGYDLHSCLEATAVHPAVRAGDGLTDADLAAASWLARRHDLRHHPARVRSLRQTMLSRPTAACHPALGVAAERRAADLRSEIEQLLTSPEHQAWCGLNLALLVRAERLDSTAPENGLAPDLLARALRLAARFERLRDQLTHGEPHTLPDVAALIDLHHAFDAERHWVTVAEHDGLALAHAVDVIPHHATAGRADVLVPRVVPVASRVPVAVADGTVPADIVADARKLAPDAVHLDDLCEALTATRIPIADI